MESLLAILRAEAAFIEADGKRHVRWVALSDKIFDELAEAIDAPKHEGPAVLKRILIDDLQFVRCSEMLPLSYALIYENT